MIEGSLERYQTCDNDESSLYALRLPTRANKSPETATQERPPRARAKTSKNSQSPIVLVGVTSGQTEVNQRKSATHFSIEMGAGTLNNLDLFGNWMEFLPDYVKPRVHVVYPEGDEKARQHVASQNVTHEAGAFNSHEMANWAWRVKALQELLQQGEDVIVSDLDTVWLKDPVPFLTNFSESVVGMRGFDGWYTLCCGFAFFRSSFAPLVGEWLRYIRLGVTDQEAFAHSFLYNILSWSEQAKGTSVGTSRDQDFTIRLLPVHEFPREFTMLPGCLKCPATITDQRMVRTCCIDDQVMVLHHKGEILRDRQTGHPPGFPTLWKL